jgi:ethanolamine-phosphate cytidylyltransferase
LLHYGHMNAFRLARSLGTHLIVGLNSDESISECKGPPLMKDDERLTMVSACKFVDEVIPGCPYVVRFRLFCIGIVNSSLSPRPANQPTSYVR